MDIGAFKNFLANGKDQGQGFSIPQLPQVSQDAEDIEANAKMAKTFLKKTLTEHDKVYHPNGYDPSHDKCNFRAMMKKHDNVDALLAENPKTEAKVGMVEYLEDENGEKKIVDVIEVADMERGGAEKVNVTDEASAAIGRYLAMQDGEAE